MFTRDLELPRGRQRQRVWAGDSDVMLRGSEVRTLATVGAFRVVPAGDLRDGDDRPLDPHRGDLRHLKDSGLVDTIPAGGDERALVVLTERGRDVLERNRWSTVHAEELRYEAIEREYGRIPDDGRRREARPQQQFDVGIRSARHTRFAVYRPRELMHDAQVYRAYLKEADRLREDGASIRRVVLDHELKREYQQFLQARNRGKSEATAGPIALLRRFIAGLSSTTCPTRMGTCSFPMRASSTRTATGTSAPWISKSRRCTTAALTPCRKRPPGSVATAPALHASSVDAVLLAVDAAVPVASKSR